MNLPTAFTLARAYIALLRADLTPEAIAEAHSTYGQSDARFSPPCDASNFYHSLAIQLIEHGTLSPRQAEYAAKAALGRCTSKNAEAFEALKNSLT